MNGLAKKAYKYSQGTMTDEEKEKYFDLYFKLRKKEDNKFYNKFSHEKRIKIYKKLLTAYKFKNRYIDNSVYEILKPRSEKSVESLRYTMIVELDDNVKSVVIESCDDTYIAEVINIDCKKYINLKQKTIDDKEFKITKLNFDNKSKVISGVIKLEENDDKVSFTQTTNDDIKINKIRKRSIIFAPTHICKADAEILGEAIGEHFYAFVGDFEHLQGTFSGFVLGLMGVEYVAENVKKDRFEAAKRMVVRMGDGGNLYLCPEGTWNLEPALLALHIYWGFAKIAKMTNALVEPIAIERYDEVVNGKMMKKYYIKFDEYLDPMLYGDRDEDLTSIANLYRDIVATLKYEIFEHRGIFKRADLDIKEWEKEAERRVLEWYNYTVEYNNYFMFKPKHIVRVEDVMKDTIDAILDLPHNQPDYEEKRKIKTR